MEWPGAGRPAGDSRALRVVGCRAEPADHAGERPGGPAVSVARRLGLAVLLLPANAWPQSLELSSVVTIAHGDHRVDAGLGVERATGLLVGGATRLRYGGIALTLSGETGHLTAI